MKRAALDVLEDRFTIVRHVKSLNVLYSRNRKMLYKHALSALFVQTFVRQLHSSGTVLKFACS